MDFLPYWLAITTTIRPILYKNFIKVWLHVVLEMLRCIGSHLQYYCNINIPHTIEYNIMYNTIRDHIYNSTVIYNVQYTVEYNIMYNNILDHIYNSTAI